jgi:hypothetical protein
MGKLSPANPLPDRYLRGSLIGKMVDGMMKREPSSNADLRQIPPELDGLIDLLARILAEEFLKEHGLI